MTDISTDLLQQPTNILIEKFGGKVKNKVISNKKLTKELQNSIIRKFNKRKVHSFFIDNIWGTALADVQLVSKFNKGFRFLLWVIDIYSKKTWVFP